MKFRFIHLFMRSLRRPRLVSAALLALVLFGLMWPQMSTTRALLIAFNAGAALFLGLMFALMSRATVASMHLRASLQEEGKWVVLLFSLSVALAVLGALSQELHAAKIKSLGGILLASSTILLAWLFVAVVFAQHYAHSYYLAPGQLQFPGTPAPDYWDFTYFSLVLSMCCQTSDVAITSSPMRRVATLHSVVSFFFNVIIIAITVNVVAGAF